MKKSLFLIKPLMLLVLLSSCSAHPKRGMESSDKAASTSTDSLSREEKYMRRSGSVQEAPRHASPDSIEYPKKKE